MVKNYLLVALGGSLGSMVRYSFWLLLRQASFPLSTLLVNVTGSFIIGVILGISMVNESFSMNWKLFLATGLCGGFTTFSAFSLENLQMLQSGKYLLSILYITTSIILGLTAAWLGFKMFNN